MKSISIFLLLCACSCADTAIDPEAVAKAIQPDPSFDKSEIIGSWSAAPNGVASIIFEPNGVVSIIGGDEPVVGTWVAGLGGKIIVRAKESESKERLMLFSLVGDKLVDDQTCYKIIYSRK